MTGDFEGIDPIKIIDYVPCTGPDPAVSFIMRRVVLLPEDWRAFSSGLRLLTPKGRWVTEPDYDATHDLTRRPDHVFHDDVPMQRTRFNYWMQPKSYHWTAYRDKRGTTWWSDWPHQYPNFYAHGTGVPNHPDFPETYQPEWGISWWISERQVVAACYRDVPEDRKLCRRVMALFDKLTSRSLIQDLDMKNRRIWSRDYAPNGSYGLRIGHHARAWMLKHPKAYAECSGSGRVRPFVPGEERYLDYAEPPPDQIYNPEPKAKKR